LFTRNACHAITFAAQDVWELVKEQTAFILITQQYLNNKQEDQTISTRNKSFQQCETTHLGEKICFPLENYSGA
jgi:hypothetical protein